MINNFLKEVIARIVGKQFEELAILLSKGDYVNEFIISKKLDITINQTRNLLYKLSDYGLISSTRKKDKKKGWYTYFWKLEIMKALEFLKSNLIKSLEEINQQIKSRETKQFYICERCKIEVNEETALNYDFACKECGDIFKLKDNTKLIKELSKNKDKLNETLKELEEILTLEQEKINKNKGDKITKNKKSSKVLVGKNVKKEIKSSKKIAKKKIFQGKKVVNKITKKISKIKRGRNKITNKKTASKKKLKFSSLKKKNLNKKFKK